MGRARIVAETLNEVHEIDRYLREHEHEVLFTEHDAWKDLWYVLAEGPAMPKWSKWTEPMVVIGIRGLIIRIGSWRVSGLPSTM